MYQNHDGVVILSSAAAFYLNRTNVSGILSGGVIGGLEQTGTIRWTFAFNRRTLKKRSWTSRREGTTLR